MMCGDGAVRPCGGMSCAAQPLGQCEADGQAADNELSVETTELQPCHSHSFCFFSICYFFSQVRSYRLHDGLCGQPTGVGWRLSWRRYDERSVKGNAVASETHDPIMHQYNASTFNIC
jgi:hypothetical protein